MITVASLLTALLTYGPTIIPLVSKLVSDIEAGRGAQAVTAADLAELVRLSNQSAEEIFKRAGVVPPPP